jgi:hypothetical protein
MSARGDLAGRSDPIVAAVRRAERGVTRSCSWCHETNRCDIGEPTYCTACGHRVDVARRYCTCEPCRLAKETPK